MLRDNNKEYLSMKQLRVVMFVVATVVLSLELSGQRKPDPSEVASRKDKLLTVHMDIVTQNYCRPDDEAFVANLTLRLRFNNASANTVILSRRIESPAIVRAAHDTEAASHDEFVYAPDAHFMLNKTPPKAPSFRNAPNSKLFATLAPGGNFETLVKTSVIGVAKGSYVLQIGVHTWPYDWPYFTAKTDPQELKARWSKYGDLATGLLMSDFASFTISEEHKFPPCP
jgi:hypothetical protein